MHLIKRQGRGSGFGTRGSGPARKKAVWGSGIRLFVGLLIAALSSACGDMQRQGTGSSFLIVESLTAASGASGHDIRTPG